MNKTEKNNWNYLYFVLKETYKMKISIRTVKKNYEKYTSQI